MNDFYYRRLDAYNLSKQYTIQVYQLLRKFPEYERFALCDQLRRAVISIPSNIAEGTGRMAIKERIHFLDIAYGSLNESMCQLEISKDLGYITLEDFNSIENTASRVSMTIIGLKKALQDKLNKQNSTNQNE
jgi:four helix bundle protein